jgi:hypothetical protein
MLYRMLGRAHAEGAAAWSRLTGAARGERGQGTVEYVALILLVSVVLAGVVAATKGFKESGDIGKSIVNKLKEAMNDVGGK